MLGAALFWRPARARPLRLAATVLGVAAGVASLVSTRVSTRAAVGTLTQDVLALAGPAELEVVQDGGVELATIAALTPLADELDVRPVVDQIVLAPALGDTLRLLGLDLVAVRDDPRIALAASDAAALPLAAVARGLDCQGAWISAGLARELGVAPGGEVEIEVRAHAVQLEVLGLFTPRTETRAFDRVLVLDVACAQELLLRTDRVDRLELVPRVPAEPGARANAALEARVADLLPAAARVQTPSARANEVHALASALEFHLHAMSLISLLVGGVLVAISLATSVVQRREVLALCVSLGASRTQLARVLALEAVLIGACGGLVGTCAGWAASLVTAGGVRATLITTIGQPPPGVVTPEWSDLVFGVALGACSALAAALLPILEARRTPPVQNLRRERPRALGVRARTGSLAAAAVLVACAPLCALVPPWGTLPVPALAGSFALLAALFLVLGPLFELAGHAGSHARLPARAGTLVRLALSALSAGRRRAVWAAGAVGIAVGLSVAIATVVGSFRETIVDWGNTAFTADFWVRPRSSDLGGVIGRLDPALVETLRARFGTDTLDPFYFNRARFEGETVGLTGAEFAVVRRRGIMRFEDGREPRAVFEQAHARGEVVVNEAFGLRFGRHAGDLITFEAAGRMLEKRIAGVFVDYGDSRGDIVLNGPEYRALFPADAPAQVALFLPDEVDRDAAKRDFLASLGPDVRVEMVSVADVRRRMLEVFEQTFAITRGMELVAAAVAVIAVLTVLFALLAERRSEVGILRALGASSAQVGASIGVQAGLLGAAGALVGCGAGIGVGWLLVDVVQAQSFRWTIELHLPWLAMAETFAGVTLVCAAAGLWPALVAARWSPREMLRETG